MRDPWLQKAKLACYDSGNAPMDIAKSATTPTAGYRAFPNGERAYKAIVARLESKSDHMYMWPRWAAAEEAVQALAEAGLLKDE
jgi:hypothetical protein